MCGHAWEARPKAKSSAASSRSHPPVSPASKSNRPPQSSSAKAPQDSKDAVGAKKVVMSARSLRAEMGAEEYLEQDGKSALDKSLATIEEKFGSAVFCSTSISEDHLKHVSKEAKSLCADLRGLHGACINLQWKVKKRSNPHAEAVEIMQAMRPSLSSLELGDIWHFVRAGMHWQTSTEPQGAYTPTRGKTSQTLIHPCKDTVHTHPNAHTHTHTYMICYM